MAFWTHCTKTGRIVYDRKPKKFRFSDALRILRSLSVSQILYPDSSRAVDLVLLILYWIAGWSNFQELVLYKNLEGGEYTWPMVIRTIIRTIETRAAYWEDDKADFSGGGFGGGGAGGEIPSPGEPPGKVPGLPLTP